jgi:hypothetical protein
MILQEESEMSWSMKGLFVTSLLLAGLVLTACGGAAEEPEVVGGFEIPAIEDGMFNVAMVLIGPHDDGGWSEAHYDGLLYVEENVSNTHVAFIELVYPSHRF